MSALNATAMQTDTPGDKVRLLTLADLDGRTAAAKRARGLVEAVAADLGGELHLTAAQRELVTRAAVLGAVLQDSEVRMLAGEDVDLSGYLQAINVQRRVLTSLGLERKARDVTPRLSDYIQGQGQPA